MTKKQLPIMHPSRIHDWADVSVKLLFVEGQIAIRHKAYIEDQVRKLQALLRKKEQDGETT